MRYPSRRSRAKASKEFRERQRGITFETRDAESYIHDARPTGHRRNDTSTIQADTSRYNRVWIGRDGRVWWRRVDCTRNETVVLTIWCQGLGPADLSERTA